MAARGTVEHADVHHLDSLKVLGKNPNGGSIVTYGGRK